MRFLPLSLAAILIACDSTAGTTPVHDIQGTGSSSPFEGLEVLVEGVVTGDFQSGDDDATRDLGGFYIQGAADSDDATSDGIFVFDGANPAIDVEPGDFVVVSGTVNEYFGETQISASSVAVTGTGPLQPVPVTFPIATTENSDGELIADLERYEGMFITFPQTLTVSQLRNLERFGEILLAEGGREYSYTNLNAPDVAGYAAHRKLIAGRRVHLDDGLRNNNAGSTLKVRSGDEITDLTGVLRFSRGSGGAGTEAYRLMPTIDPVFDHVNPRPAAPDVDGSLRVAMVNLNNFFSTVDTGRKICGPSRDANCRGADSDEELTRQLAKIVTVLKAMDADIVALIELENNASESLQTIVDSFNDSIGAGTYDFIDTGTIGKDGIKVGLIYKPEFVQPAGDFAILDRGVDVRFDDSKNRPVLAQSFDTVADAHRFTILANHLKSKGSPCDSAGDPNLGDGQGNCSATRSLAAAAMIDWMAGDPTSSGSSDFLVIGDFNTHTMGDAMSQFEIAGYTNLANHFLGETAYSFEFRGQFGALDHAIASPSLAAHAVDAAEWHINADEADLHDYNLEFDRNPDIFDASTPYRATDHDPLIIGFEFSD